MKKILIIQAIIMSVAGCVAQPKPDPLKKIKQLTRGYDLRVTDSTVEVSKRGKVFYWGYCNNKDSLLSMQYRLLSRVNVDAIYIYSLTSKIVISN